MATLLEKVTEVKSELSSIQAEILLIKKDIDTLVEQLGVKRALLDSKNERYDYVKNFMDEVENTDEVKQLDVK